MSEPNKGSPAPDQSWHEWLRKGAGLLDGVILVLLGAMLLPLIVGPFVLMYSLAIDGAYAGAAFIGFLFGLLALVVIRAVRRGEFGPGVLGLVLALLAGMVVVAKMLPRWGT